MKPRLEYLESVITVAGEWGSSTRDLSTGVRLILEQFCASPKKVAFNACNPLFPLARTVSFCEG